MSAKTNISNFLNIIKVQNREVMAQYSYENGKRV